MAVLVPEVVLSSVALALVAVVKHQNVAPTEQLFRRLIDFIGRWDTMILDVANLRYTDKAQDGQLELLVTRDAIGSICESLAELSSQARIRLHPGCSSRRLADSLIQLFDEDNNDLFRDDRVSLAEYTSIHDRACRRMRHNLQNGVAALVTAEGLPGATMRRRRRRMTA